MKKPLLVFMSFFLICIASGLLSSTLFSQETRRVTNRTVPAERVRAKSAALVEKAEQVAAENPAHIHTQSEQGRFDGPLGHLTKLQTGKARRSSSAAPQRSSNSDQRNIPAGETLVLADIKDGPGMIKHMWITFPAPQPDWLGKDGKADHSELVLRMYWDGAEEPAVEAPFGDFFAAGFGQRAPINSMPIMVEGGDAYNCFWLMPFHKSAKITVENQSDKKSGSFYYQIDYTLEDSLPEKTPYFCAQYRQEFPTKSGRDYLILDAEGEGHYVGTVLSGRSRSTEWFGEGDEKFYIDGDETPTIQGTGTEDYALNAWGMGTGTYPYFGVSILEGEWGMVGWYTTIYRWHIIDTIPFKKSLRVEIENCGWITEDELKEGEYIGHVEKNDDYASVAFWYQLGQPKRFATLPSAKERKLPNLDIIIEGKDLLPTLTKSEGTDASLQKGWFWTGDGQIFFNNPKGKEGWFEVKFNVEGLQENEIRQLTLRATKAGDYGVYRILLDGEEVRPRVDFYFDGSNNTGDDEDIKMSEISLGQLKLKPGEHTLRFECIGTRGESEGGNLGLDSVRLRKRWNYKRAAPPDVQIPEGVEAEYLPWN
ncbi:MAG: glycoside hydrolase family 172 protein [Thermoguttaceae bacterium]